jgi:uncharacterized protein
MSRRAFLRLLGAGAAATAGATALGGSVAAAYRFDVVPISAMAPSLRAPLRLAWLSDLHYGPLVHAGSVSAWVDATLTLEPDLIVLGGDVVDYQAPDDLEPLLAQLARLRAPLGVFAIWGNHEYGRFRDLGAFRDRLALAGVTALVDRGERPRDDLYLVGLDTGRVGSSQVAALVAGRPDGAACVVASHRPDVLPRVPESVDLTLCGHTHGGQVRLPFVGPVLVDRAASRRFSTGWFRAPALGYVSRGLGVGRIPVRINCPAELTLVTLTPG